MGNQYQERVRTLRNVSLEESHLINSLEVALLHGQLHYYELKDPPPDSSDYEKLREKLEDMAREIQDVQYLWLTFQEYYAPENLSEFSQGEAIASQLIAQYNPILQDVLQPIDPQWLEQIQQLSTSTNPDQLLLLRDQIASIYTLEQVEAMHNLSKDLGDLYKQLEGQWETASVLSQQVALLRTQIIVISMFISCVMGILCAIITSRAITQPLRSLTAVAEQVTEESDFSLQAPVTTQDEIGVLAVALNELIARVQELLAEQQAANTTQLLQSEKMSSLGRMLAGVAHEINNPVNFIYGNVTHATEYVDDLLRLLETYQREIPNPPESIEEQAEEIDLDFLTDDLPKLLNSMRVGADRTRQIVLSLKNFSRLDEAQPRPVNLKDCLESTLLILHNRLKQGVQVSCDYGEIPDIDGFSSSLYQVFMNLISNALDALPEPHPTKPKLSIKTELCQDRTGWVAVRIADNGCGIPPEQQSKIFEAFYTTKPVGVGTGLGLAITRQLVMEKHGGEIQLNSEVGKGTEFIILLPIKHQDEVLAA
ncbi:HAMP domain-containing histidine kinase [Spirulina subsalsa FACHB-351]|uniref:histidine kinase n=2 Tax=Spirulina subsalsa TaxID=54311 RepID=A0ABT3LBQ9_9CYAN|nr:HAMP domain-containing histidine kinase [Spirulina subsalsa FACHB-351]